MPFAASNCCCKRHEEWRHQGDLTLRNATYTEEKFYCFVDSRHNSRKRKICLACRNRIAVEERCLKLQKIETNKEFNNHNANEDVSIVEHVPVPDAHIQPGSVNDQQEPANLDESYYHLPPKTSMGTQEPAVPLKPYNQVQDRTKLEMRKEIVWTVLNCAKKYVHGDCGKPLSDFMQDVTSSRTWMKHLGRPAPKSDATNQEYKFLNKLAAEYKACNNKETVKEVRKAAKLQKQKFLIGNTKSGSRISFAGETPEDAKTRVEAARKIGRVTHTGDEKRRLLSIVATDYPYRKLQEIFVCSPNTVTAARVHCVLFGRGGSPPPCHKFTRQRVDPEVIKQLTGFLNEDDIARPSSCRSVLIDGEETGVRYWQDSIKNVVQQYLLKFPNGVKRTYIYMHLPRNFRTDTMLAGLCNICDDSGHTNFDEFCNLIQEISQLSGCTIDSSEFQKQLRSYQTFLKCSFSKVAQRHSTCAELCLDYAFGACKEEHTEMCKDMNEFHNICDNLTTAMKQSRDAAGRVKLEDKLVEVTETHWEYVAHLLRTKHQGEYYKLVLKSLQPGECVVVVDYKMKLEMGKRMRENQREWYGKRGISLHGFYVVAQLTEDNRSAEVIDLWSEDTKQDTWFSQSALDVGFTWLETVFPGFRVHLFSDNGPHYHNTGFLTYLAEVNSAFNLTMAHYTNFEAGEGKTILDTHFAHISHKIVRWVRVGNDLESGKQLVDLLTSIKNTTCRQLVIDRARAPKNIGTFKEISLFGHYSFPTEGEHSAGIIAQSLAGRGKTSKKTAAQLKSLTHRSTSVAGATGASVCEQPLSSNIRAEVQEGPSDENYSLQFIQLSPDPVQPANKERVTVHPHKDRLPKPGFGLKKSSGKRVLFTDAQKDIMIQLYERQATGGHKATTDAAIAMMKERGLELLKATQIKSWWGTYHQKRKQTMNELAAQVRNLTARTQQTAETSGQMGTAASSLQPSSLPRPCTTVQGAQPRMTDPVSQPSTGAPVTQPSTAAPVSEQSTGAPVTQPSTAAPVSEQSTAAPVSQPSTGAPVTQQSTQAPVSNTATSVQHSTTSVLQQFDHLVGKSSLHTPQIIEWRFPSDCSQSTLLNRTGSNACTFIALVFGQLFFASALGAPHDGRTLCSSWYYALMKAIIKGNEIHDDLYDYEAADVAVDEAIEVAGGECGVEKIVCQFDIIGRNANEQLATAFKKLISFAKPSCSVIVTSGRSVLFIVNLDGSCIIVDSHTHLNSGALISFARPGHSNYMAQWFIMMVRETWNVELDVNSASVICVHYL